MPQQVMIDAARAAGVMSYREASRQYGEAHLRAQLVARRWQAPTKRSIVLHNGALDAEQRMWVSLLTAPPGASLHGLSAAVQDGLRGFTPDRLGLVIPGSSRNPRAARSLLPRGWPVSLHWSTMLGPEDVNDDAIPPRTRLPRSIVDAASERVPVRRSLVLVLAGVQQRLVRPRDLRDALSRRGRCRNRRVITESIADAEGGIASLPEQEFDRIRASRGLPVPHRQRVLRRKDGRYYLDNDWPEWGIRCEIHGIPHLAVRNWDDDLLRQNDITIAGGGLLVFSSYAIRHAGTRVGDQLTQLFLARGATPSIRR